MNYNSPNFPNLKESELVFVPNTNGSLSDTGIHTFSVIETNNYNEKYKYRGYAGFDRQNKIDLWFSDDLKKWVEYSKNPIMNNLGLRWPSVIIVDDIFYIAARRHTTRFQKVVDRFNVFSYKNMKFHKKLKMSIAGDANTYINLYKSIDGIQFDFYKTIIPKGENNNPHNQNPFLFVDPVSEKIFLFYYSGNEYNNFEIRVRYADNIEKLDRDKDEMIIKSDKVLAAPGVFYDENTGKYWILVETTVNSKWAVKAFCSKKITSNYQTIHNPISVDDCACPFPFVNENMLYLFVSKRVGSHKWKEMLYSANLSVSESP